MSEPRWSTTPPTEPGWYWVRDVWETFVVWLDDGSTWWSMATADEFVVFGGGYEFWPVPIVTPPEM